MRRVLVEAGRYSLSGLLAQVDAPRGTVVALHGGGVNAGYFHGGAAPELSLLAIGAAAGWNVLALDRPGYGASAELAEADRLLSAQAEIVLAALDGFAATHDVGAGFVLVGHSNGFKLAIQVAALPRGVELLGLDGSGVGLRYLPRRYGIDPDVPPPATVAQVFEVFWGPADLYPPDTLRGRRAFISISAKGEAAQLAAWSPAFPGLASRIRIPVRATLAAHEQWWVVDEDELAALGALFTAAPLVETCLLPDASHNVSLGWAARPYHLAALAFAERCLLRARLAGGAAQPRQSGEKVRVGG
ncbi:AB hydrolase-1 domain-containing protein [Frankia sp. AiPs1]